MLKEGIRFIILSFITIVIAITIVPVFNTHLYPTLNESAAIHAPDYVNETTNLYRDVYPPILGVILILSSIGGIVWIYAVAHKREYEQYEEYNNRYGGLL